MKRKILFSVCLLTGVVFINSGFDKFLHYMPTPTDLLEKVVKPGTAFSAIEWLLPLVGAIELLSGLLLIFDRTRALGAIILVPVLTGVLLANIHSRKKYLPMIQN